MNPKPSANEERRMMTSQPPRILNARQVGKFVEGAVYVGRPSKWGNPYEIGKDGTRAEVIAKYEELLRSSPRMMKEVKDELAGRDLICWCHPSPCHAEVLLRIANTEI